MSMNATIKNTFNYIEMGFFFLLFFACQELPTLLLFFFALSIRTMMAVIHAWFCSDAVISWFAFRFSWCGGALPLPNSMPACEDIIWCMHMMRDIIYGVLCMQRAPYISCSFYESRYLRDDIVSISPALFFFAYVVWWVDVSIKYLICLIRGSR